MVVDVTEANIGDFSIEDIVMPMIGHDINLPKNEELRKIMMDAMLADGITMDNFAGLAANDSISASGSYRKIVTKPEEVWFDIVEMQNENEDLLTPNYLSNPDPKPVIVDSDDPAFVPVSKALRMRFNLKTSSYATMLLREVTRTSSAFSSQYKLSMNKK